ncbi:MAG: hypothetical protein JNK66_07370, partial [Chitinophagales bacterium]|nr:hypothetical protein [Chitinophagales bacterium]
TLYEQDGTTVISTTTTDAIGNYVFTNLDEGSYVVGFSNLPAGFSISPKDADSQGLNGELNSDVNIGSQKTDIIALGIGEDKMSVDMGLIPPAGTASLGNSVWYDLNNDGLQTAGEPGVQGVSVTLYDNANNVVASTTTNGNGEYYFVGLTPGTYYVGFGNLPEGYSFTTENSDAQGVNGPSNSDANATTGLTASVTLAAGDNNQNVDAGVVSTTVAAIGDYVWYDVDQDGIQDANESGLGGILVTLYDNTNTPVASTITTPEGFYIFTNVVPGTYTIGFSNIPVGMVFTQQVGGPSDNNNSNVIPTTGLTASFTVTAGTYNPTIDAGLTTPINAGLGNYVWLDANENGLQDITEPGVAGVVVTLYASDGTTVLATAVTDGNGQYSFTNLTEGNYIVGFSNLPQGSTPTQNLGVLNDANNSDMHPVTKKTESIFLSAGIYNPNVDGGIYFGIPLTAKELIATVAVIHDEHMSDVYWFTSEEENTLSFDVERSIDGQNFVKVGEKAAKGQTNGRTDYMLTDDIEAVKTSAIIYYRIRLNDIDGQLKYSNTISVRPNDNSLSAIVYPTPFTDELTILYPCIDATDIEIVLTDLSGRVIRKEVRELLSGKNIVRIDGLNGLAIANYFLKIRDLNSGDQFIRKVAK